MFERKEDTPWQTGALLWTDNNSYVNVFTAVLSYSLCFPSLVGPRASSLVGFKCSSPSTCESLIDYVSPNFTTISEIKTLFGIKHLHSILGANSLPLNTPPTQLISAKQKIKIPFSCICINGWGIPNKKPVYMVQKDDWLDHIARDIFAELVTFQQIAVVNHIPNPDEIEIGDHVWIPLPCSCNPMKEFNVVHYGHVVEEGNSVEKIAEKYGSTEDTLLMVNGISDPKALRAGTVLDVPLRACSSEIRNTSWDYPLLVSNGTYALTANTCVKCKCESSNNWTLHCEPSAMDQVKLHNWHRCPSMQCQGPKESIGNLSLGNHSSPESSCDRKACSYAGYTNETIFTTFVDASHCGAVGGSQTPNGPTASNNLWEISLQGSRCRFIHLFIFLLLFNPNLNV